MKRRITLAAAVAAVAVACSLAATATALAGPFDASGSLHRTVGVPLATPSLLPGELDLTSVGVADSELATAGLAGAQTSGDDERDDHDGHGDDGGHHGGPPTLVVDDDRAQCPDAQYQRIQDAVDAAPAGAQIRVCPGTYPEQVRIPKNNLTLYSQKPWQAVIQAPAVMTYPNSIVTVSGATGVTIRQFTITGPFTFGGCAEAVDRHTGVRIINGSATIYGNHITKIRDVNPLLFGCQDGIAVLVGRQFESEVGKATLLFNLIDQYQKGGVVVDNTGSFAWITYNAVIGEGLNNLIAQNGVQVGRGGGADIDHNVIAKNQYSNPVVDDAASGVLLFDTSNTSAGSNDVGKNGYGIVVDSGTIAAEIDHNNVHDNINDGIAAFMGSANNLISYNNAHDNTPYDCYDETTGTRTAGTANTWFKDIGQTQNRPGLCKRGH